MNITHHTNTRLVISHRRILWAFVLALFTAMSLFFLFSILSQGLRFISTMNGGEIMAFILWIGVAILFVIGGATSCAVIGRGTECTFDKQREIMILRTPHLWRSSFHEYPIYGVSHLEVKHNEEVRVFGVFLVLRSGERIALGTVTPFDEAHVRNIGKTVRKFLYST